MTHEPLKLVSKSKFASPGMKLFAIVAARLSGDDREFYLSEKFMEKETGIGRSSYYDYREALVSVGLFLTNGKSGKKRRFRFNIPLLRKLHAQEVLFKRQRVPVKRPKADNSRLEGGGRTRAAWRLVEVSASGSDCSPDLAIGIQQSDGGISDSPNNGENSSSRRTLKKIEQNTNYLTPPNIAARDKRRSDWGEWDEVESLVEIAKRDPELQAAVEFFHLIRENLAPPKHFSAQQFAHQWLPRLKPFSADVLQSLAEQQLRTRTHRVDTLPNLVATANKIATAAEGQKVGGAEDYLPPAQWDLPELWELDKCVWKLGFLANLSFRQLRFEGVSDSGVAVFAGNGVAVDGIDKDHREAFENLLFQCFPKATRVEFKRDRPCR